jgi:Protein of unknown function (DUF3616)
MPVTIRSLIAAACWCAATLPAFAEADRLERYGGICDASAAVALGNGRFVVADDECDVLRVYRRGVEKEVGHLDLAAYLRNGKAGANPGGRCGGEPGGNKHEADIEGAARIGERIYWIGSHARKGKSGKVDPHRHRLFATDIVGSAGARTVRAAAGAPHESLLAELVADPRFAVLAAAAAAPIGPEVDGGFNIEGLAATVDGGLLIGFRNPVPDRRALVVPLRNPAAVLESNARPVFGDLIRLDLGGRGIRSLERVGDALLIAAGPFNDAKQSPIRPAFALYRWNGSAAEAPQFVRALDDGTFRPEALFVDADANELVLLSDDGDEKVGVAPECKDKSMPAARKSFRARVLTLPPR